MRHDLPQALLRDDEHLTWLPHDRGHEHRLASDQPQLPEEPSRSVDADHPLTGARLLDHRHLPFQDHEEVAVPVTLPVENVPGPTRRCSPTVSSALICPSLSLGTRRRGPATRSGPMPASPSGALQAVRLLAGKRPPAPQQHPSMTTASAGAPSGR